MSTKQPSSTEKGEQQQPDRAGKFQSGTRKNRTPHTNGQDDHTQSSRRKPGQPTSRPHHHGNTGGSASAGRDSSRNKTGNWESAHSRSRGNQKDSEQYKTKPRDGHTHSQSKTHRHTKSTTGKPHPPNQSTKLQQEDEGVTLEQDKEEEEEINDSYLPERDHTTNTTDNTNTVVQDLVDSSEVVCNDGSDDRVEVKDGEGVISRFVYDRDHLLILKECTLSLLTPLGFDSMETEIVKDILKRHNSSSSSNDTSGDNENEVTSTSDDLKPKHPTTLTLMREHDTKVHSKVSLTPQRRSFGSGCSWRESPSKAPPTSEPEPEKDEVFHNNRHVATPTTNHTPKIIDHIPYRSRSKGEWQETPPITRRRVNSWRDAPPPNHVLKEADDEPEWMSYGPSDPTELMELRGIDEHEIEKEARKSNDSLLDDKQDDITPDPSPSSSSSPPGGSKGDSDSGLPSSSPLDDEHEYMLDGFDFSTGVSICQTFDSDEENDINPLPNNANKYQLTTALMNVLNISGDRQEGVVRDTPISSRPLHAMTLDEIEESHQQETGGDQDQTAFNKLLAAINSPRGSEPHPQRGNEQHLQRGIEPHLQREPHPQRPPQEVGPMGVVSDVNRTLYSTEEQEHYIHRYQDNQPNRHYRQEEQWTTSSTQWGTHQYRPQMFKPHPSTLGIQPNPHLRQAPPLPAPPTNNWITEMEHRRRAELMIMEDRQRAAAHLQQVQRSTSGGGRPSIGFLPTAVIRQMHSKTHTTSHQPTQIEHNSSQHERDYPRMTPPAVVAGHQFHPPSLLPPHMRGVASSQHLRSVGGTTVRQIDPMGGASGYPPPPHLQMMPPYRIAYQQ